MKPSKQIKKASIKTIAKKYLSEISGKWKREDAILWIKQAEADLKSAEDNINCKNFYLVVNLSHQVAEKSLKAFIIHQFKEKLVEIHSLVRLGEIAQVPAHLLSLLRKLSPQYISSKYPDQSGNLPTEIYDEEIAKESLACAKEVFTWTKKRLA